jgi:hypothetical protein
MNNKNSKNNSSGGGATSGFLIGTLLTSALSFFIYKKDKGKTFDGIVKKIDKLVASYIDDKKLKTSFQKKTIDVSQESLNSVPKDKDQPAEKTQNTKKRTFTKSKK